MAGVREVAISQALVIITGLATSYDSNYSYAEHHYSYTDYNYTYIDFDEFEDNSEDTSSSNDDNEVLHDEYEVYNDNSGKNCTHLCGPTWPVWEDSCIVVNCSCYPEYKTQICNGAYLLLRELCNGECDEYSRNIGGACVSEWEVQNCNGEFIVNSELCDGRCPEFYINIRGTCVEELSTRLCRNVPILEEDLCDEKCFEPYFIYFNGKCVSEQDVRQCNGELTPSNELCYGCGKNVVNVSGACVQESLTWVCQGVNLKIETPCNGSCFIGWFIANGKCTDRFWKCGDTFQSIETPCDGECFSDSLCLKNGRCFEIESSEEWSCDKSCDNLQPLSDPCNGLCPNSKERYPSTFSHFSDSHGYANIGGQCQKGNICHVPTLDEVCDDILKCDEEVVLPIHLRCVNTSVIKEETQYCYPYCEGNICVNYCYEESSDNCEGHFCVDSCKETDDGTWKCFAKCNSNDKPCWGHCQEGAVLLAGKCVLADETFMCGVETQLLEDPCAGKCVEGRVYIDGKCLKNTWKCEGSIRPAKEPCDGKCPDTKLQKYIDYRFDTLKYLSDYVKCGGKCLLRSEAWDCYGTCQAHSEPCNSRCLDVTCVAQESQLKVWKYILIDGKCDKVKDNTGCASDAEVPIYTSPITKTVLLHTMNLGTLAGLSPGPETICPPTHCTRGGKCCKLAWFGENGGLQCPFSC